MDPKEKQPDETWLEYDARMQKEEASTSAPPTRKGADGKLYEYVNGQWQLAGNEFQPQAPDLGPIQSALQEVGAVPVNGIPSNVGNVDIRSLLGLPSGAFSQAQQNSADTYVLPNGKPFSTNPDVLALLKLAGVGSSGGSGDGVGYANLAQRQQEFEYQKQQDQLALALNVLKQISGQSDQWQQAAQAGKQNQLAALGYAVDPSQQYFSGFSPTSYGARMGLIEPQRIQHQQFDPSLGANPYMGQVDQGLARLQAMGG